MTIKLTAFLLLSLSALAQDPFLVLKKEFPGSKPAYAEIRIEKNGKVEYKEAADDEQPVRFALRQSEADTLFLLSDKLDHFSKTLESGLKVAKMGDKTFVWQKGAQRHEARFNYTTDPDAQALLDWFERMCESAQLFIDLERTARFDKLGVNQSILRIEAAWDRKRLVGVEQYLPLLDRVVKNESYLNMARERAAKLAEIFRNPPPQSAAGDSKQ